MHTIVITGATGHVGSEVATHLLAAGHKVRAVGRSRERLERLTSRGAEAHVGSVEDAHFMMQTMVGADAAFVMIPPQFAEPDFRGYQRRVADVAVSAIAEARVGHVVALSSIGAEVAGGTGPIEGLHILEQRLNRIADRNVVALRAGYFFENLLAAIPVIKSAGINSSSMQSHLPIPMVATRDIGAVAADLLSRREFQGRVCRYVLGPRDYTPAEATRILGAAIGKPDLAYVEAPYQETKRALLAAGASASVADDYVRMLQALNEGSILAQRTPTSTMSTTLEYWAAEVFAPAFQHTP